MHHGLDALGATGHPGHPQRVYLHAPARMHHHHAEARPRRRGQLSPSAACPPPPKHRSGRTSGSTACSRSASASSTASTWWVWVRVRAGGWWWAAGVGWLGAGSKEGAALACTRPPALLMPTCPVPLGGATLPSVPATSATPPHAHLPCTPPLGRATLTSAPESSIHPRPPSCPHALHPTPRHFTQCPCDQCNSPSCPPALHPAPGQGHFDQCFRDQYAVIHRLETNKLRNVAALFAHLLVGWWGWAVASLPCWWVSGDGAVGLLALFDSNFERLLVGKWGWAVASLPYLTQALSTC